MTITIYGESVNQLLPPMVTLPHLVKLLVAHRGCKTASAGEKKKKKSELRSFT
jgi:hypothetical protein